MTVVGHAVSGWIGLRLFGREAKPAWGWVLAAIVIPCLPDLDVAGMRFIPYEHVLGHRGLSHSFFAAGVFGAALAIVCVRFGWTARQLGAIVRTFLFGALLWGSHGVLDAMTTGGKGIALLAPLSAERHWLPARVIPVSLLPGSMNPPPERQRAIVDFVETRQGFPFELPKRTVGAFPQGDIFWSYFLGVVATELLLLAPLALLSFLVRGRAPPALRVVAAIAVVGGVAFLVHVAENRPFEESRGEADGRTRYRLFEPDEPATRGVAVLLHGWRCSAAMMTPLAEVLARNGVTVLVPDLPGHGRSPVALPLADDIGQDERLGWRAVRAAGDDFVEARLPHWLADAGLAGRPVALIGHSWGGFMVDHLEPAGVDVVARINLEGGSERLDEGRNQLFLGRESWVRIHVPSNRPPSPDERHGSFGDGSARELRMLPPGSHLSLIRSERINGAVLEWLAAAFGTRLGNDRRDLSGLPASYGFGALVLAFGLVGWRRSGVSPVLPAPAPARGGLWLGVTFVAALGARWLVAAVAETDPLLWRLAHEQLLLPLYFAGVGIPSALLALRDTRGDDTIADSARAAGWGVALWALVYAGAGVLVDTSLQHLVLVPERWLRFALLSLAALPITFAITSATRGFLSGAVARVWRLLLWAALLAIWGLGQAYGVRLEALQVAAIPVLCEFADAVLARRTRSPWAPATFAALAWGWLWAASYPVLA